MQNIKYHMITSGSVVLFSFIAAFTISQFIRLAMNPEQTVSFEKSRITMDQTIKKSYDDYKPIIESTFFKIASASDLGKGGDSSSGMISSSLGELQLFGTISGPVSIARALIRKRSEKDSQVFKLSQDVYGYKLVKIDNSKVYLKKGETEELLEMYGKKDENKPAPGNMAAALNEPVNTRTSQTISKAEIKQKFFNNLDNALQGLNAGPYRVDGKVDGYKIFRVPPNNFFYNLGLRSGDILKRVNGHPVDSTEKLLSYWQSLEGESKITVDIERNGRLQTFDLNITD